MSLCRDMMPTWELRTAMESAEAKVTEQADRIAQLEAALQHISNLSPTEPHAMQIKARAALEDRT